MIPLTVLFNVVYNIVVACAFVEKVLERGEKIDVLVGKTEHLDHNVS